MSNMQVILFRQHINIPPDQFQQSDLSKLNNPWKVANPGQMWQRTPDFSLDQIVWVGGQWKKGDKSNIINQTKKLDFSKKNREISMKENLYI